jgi:hypothetical protein
VKRWLRRRMVSGQSTCPANGVALVVAPERDHVDADCAVFRVA